MQKQIMILADERIGRSLLQLTVPAFFGMFVTTLYNVVDTIFIGHYVGPLGIAGLSIVFPVQMLAMGLGQMTGIGGASLVSRLLGAKEDARAQLALGNSVSSMVLISLVVLAAGEAAPEFWLRLIGASDTILPYARDYLVIILVGLVFQTLSTAFNGLVRAEGNSRVAMIGMIIGAVLNIVLDAVFVVALKWGIVGAAWATVIAQLVSVGYFVWYYRSRSSHLKLSRRDLLFDTGILKLIYSIGISSLAMTFANSLAAVVINRLLGGHGGDYAISTYGIANRIMAFAIIPAMVIGQGMQPILGYNYGAKRFRLGLKAIRLALIWSTVVCFAGFCLLYFIPQAFAGVFTDDAQLIALAVEACKRMYFFLYTLGITIVGMMTFQALGKVKQAFVTTLARPIVFLIPMVLAGAHFGGVNGIWWGFAASEVTASVWVGILLVPQVRELLRSAGTVEQEHGTADMETTAITLDGDT